MPVAVAGLTHLRHSLEHLDQALLADSAARPDPEQSRRRWALEQLPDGELPLFPRMQRRGAPIGAFGLIDVEALRTHAEQVAGHIDSERYDEEVQPAIDAWIHQGIDEMRDR